MKLTALFVLLALAAGAKELRFAMAGDPKTFDPLQVAEDNSEKIRYLTAGVLLRINRATDQIEPELAESWRIGDSGRVITFRLRKDLKFSDGSPLTAEDVARTLRRALDPKEGSPIGDSFRASSGDPSITTAPPLEITIRYKSAKPSIDRMFDSLGITPSGSVKLPATAGPYHVAEYHPGDYVRLARNPNYWKHDSGGHQLPYIESIRIDIQQNHDIELTRFLRGDLQLINRLDAESFDRVAKVQPSSARNLGTSLDSEFMWFNQAPAKTIPAWKREWFTSAAFRHALSAAIHRDDLARIVFRGYARPASGPVSSASKFWFVSVPKPQIPDPVRALAADGFSLQQGVLRDRSGHPVEFSIITNSGNRTRERSAALIQSDLRAIGIKVTIVTLEFNSMMDRISKTMDYEAAILGFANVDEDPMEQMNVWLSSAPHHAWWPLQKTPATEWEARIDKLELQQASEADRAARKRAIDQVQRIVVEQEPIIYLVNPNYLYAISPQLKGTRPGIAPPQILWNVEWLRLE